MSSLKRTAREGVSGYFCRMWRAKLWKDPSLLRMMKSEQGTLPGRAGTVTCQANHG